MSREKQRKKKQWLRQHRRDPFVCQASKDGFRSRAAYKLLAIQERDHLIKPGMIVVDLGATPGSWSQVASRYLKGCGRLLAVDRLPMSPINGVVILCGDFCDQSFVDQLLQIIDGQRIDVVLSDMSPNLSGNHIVDQAKSMNLCDLARDFALKVLKPQGSFLVKTFQGCGFNQYIMSLRQSFVSVITRNPKASRSHSRECYLLAKKVKNTICSSISL